MIQRLFEQNATPLQGCRPSCGASRTSRSSCRNRSGSRSCPAVTVQQELRDGALVRLPAARARHAAADADDLPRAGLRLRLGARVDQDRPRLQLEPSRAAHRHAARSPFPCPHCASFGKISRCPGSLRAAGAELPAKSHRRAHGQDCLQGVQMSTQRITYATMAADPNLHVEFDAAIERVKGTLGKTYPMYIGGQAGDGSGAVRRPQPDRHPHPARPVPAGRTRARAAGDRRGHARRAPAWAATPWQERVAILKKVVRRDPRAPVRPVGAR